MELGLYQVSKFELFADNLKSTREKANEIIAALSYTPDKKKSHTKDKEKSRDHKSTDRHKDKDKDRKIDRHKDKDKDKERKSSSSSSRSSRDNKKSSSSSSSRSKSSSHKSSSSSKSRDKNKDKHRSSSSSKHKTDNNAKNSPEIDLGADLEDDFGLDDDIDMDSMMIEDECLKIFNEYKAPVVEAVPPPEPLKVTVPDAEPKEELSFGKKRIAYNNAVKDEVKARPAFKPLMSAGMTLHNRMRIARQAQADNEAHGIMAEMRNIKRIAHQNTSSMVEAKKMRPNGVSRTEKPKPTPAPIPQPPSTSVIDDILNAKSTTTAGITIPPAPLVSARPAIRRIAPASNVMSIQMAKARIDEIKNRTINTGKTLSCTVPKGGKRTAHVPDMSLANIPDVLQAERSKLPVNVRTRYLGLLADECVKLYVATEDAYNRALNEEFKCYERCKALPTYRNSAMLAVNRLRKEVHEREASGLGPLQLGETAGKSTESYLDGRKFYDLVKGYMLTEEELVQHGFPREGPTPGKAVINSEYKQQATSEHLEPNQRLCCRCHKIYPINRDGFPLFEEECCYHPLRKRTIRGERTYLCCKSSEDTGCAVSGTHVSEVSADRELEGFQSTFESEIENDPRDYAVYALDCEMCYTTKGLELTRVTVVNSKLKTVYESLVKPFNPIIDYNTRFSGITAEHMENTTTNILQIQATILHLCSSKTILIGHSLESDMKALKIIHNSVVDSSVMFPHKFGLPHKRALRVLASEYLKKIIQNDVAGHDSAEDALAAMELVLWKVKEDMKVKGIKT